MVTNTTDKDADVAFELARDAIGFQLDAADGLDAKIATLMAVGSTLFGIAAAILAVKPLGNLTVALVAVSVGIPWVAISLLSVRAYQVVQFDACPDLKKVWSDYKELEVNAIKWKAADTLKDYYDKNLASIDAKADAVTFGLFALIVETGLAVGWFVAIALGLH
jgi:Zn-finger nucleic acid-binding protein